MTNIYSKLILKKGKEAPIKRNHPWVFSGAIYKIEGTPKDGDIVNILSADNIPIAMGHYQNGSILARIFSFETVEVNTSFWYQKLKKAYDYRKLIGIINHSETNAYRLIHAEGDGMPGLIIDIYNTIAIVQCHSIGMHKIRQSIVEGLLQLYGDRLEAIYDKSKETLPFNYATSIENGYLYGQANSNIILENNLSFYIDWERGQKTGFFLDQRNNRQLLTKYVKGKNVLNTFCYSGGFSIYALNAGAKLVHSVDASSKAIEWAKKNVELNSSKGKHEAYVDDVLKFLQKTTNTYDVIIVDPPAYAKSIKKRHNAVQGYKRLNALALSKLPAKGILFTFSCSQVIDNALFKNTLFAAALEARRNVRILHHLSQPEDHPINIAHPESSYLKGLVLYID